jgi:hypothetical protein
MGATVRLGFVPQDFHTCGKHCGKTGLLGVLDAQNVVFPSFSMGESQNRACFTPVYWDSTLIQ